jgi:aspartate carbamoyltransferase catalytic subunit
MSPTQLTTDPAPSGAGFFVHGIAGAAANPATDSRHLLGLEHLSAETILGILDDAERELARLERDRRPTGELAGVTVVHAFFEDSTRTRTAFELAAHRLGATVASFGSSGLSLSKGETLLDTLRIFAANGADIVVVRHASAGIPEFLARELEVGIVNAGDGAHEHPTQGLLDLMTLAQVWNGRFAGRRFAIVGDIAHSRVARSAIHGLLKLGVTVTVAGPPTLMPAGVEALGVALAPTVDDAITDADGVMTLRLQRERMDKGLLPSLGEYAREWGLDERRVSRLAQGGVVLHPGPVNRGVELTPEVADGPRSVILRQVRNGMGVRSAVLKRSAKALAAEGRLAVGGTREGRA